MRLKEAELLTQHVKSHIMKCCVSFFLLPSIEIILHCVGEYIQSFWESFIFLVFLIVLSISDPLQFVGPEGDIRRAVLVAADITLVCGTNIVGNPTPTISWMNNNGVIVSDGNGVSGSTTLSLTACHECHTWPSWQLDLHCGKLTWKYTASYQSDSCWWVCVLTSEITSSTYWLGHCKFFLFSCIIVYQQNTEWT